MAQGAFPLTGSKNLPNVTVAFPGEVWTNRRASGAITPGAAVVPVNSGGKLYVRTALAGDTGEVDRLGIALNVVQAPDVNTGPSALGPNELANKDIPAGEYVRVYYSGGFHLTLVVPTTYVPGDRIGWDADGVRPVGKTGVGAWAKDAAADLDSIFEVMEIRTVGTGSEVILTVRHLKGSQF